MRKIRLFIAASLDGYIARTSGDIDWLFTDADYGYTEFYEQIDTLLMGRKTYEQVLTFGEYPYPGKKAYIFSQRRLSEPNEFVEFITDNWITFLHQLREQPGQDIWLVGGGQLIQFCLKQGFVDELILAIHPLILGSGIPLIIQDKSLEVQLDLKQVKTYESGLLQVFYTVKH